MSFQHRIRNILLKVLWCIANPLLIPEFAKLLSHPELNTGGWISSLANAILASPQKPIELAIAAPADTQAVVRNTGASGTVFFSIPGGAKSLLDYDNTALTAQWRKVVDDFAPDLIHVHGTEYSHGYHVLQAVCDEIPVVVSIQGLVSRLARTLTDGLSQREMLRNITLRDFVKQDTYFQRKQQLKKRGYYEEQIIKQATGIIGRTDWDRANVKSINQVSLYFQCNENLREPFYTQKWDLDKIERYTIFAGALAKSPGKGFHILMRALPLICTRFPNTKLYISGPNPFQRKTASSLFLDTGFTRLIRKQIKSSQFQDHFEFTGMLSAEEMAERMSRAHVHVLPSSGENSSNTLAEAMLVGLPCIAAFTGGTPSMAQHGQSALLYPFSEYELLAEYISTVFQSDVLTQKLSQEAQKTALIRHDRQINAQTTIGIYKELLGKD